MSDSPRAGRGEAGIITARVRPDKTVTFDSRRSAIVLSLSAKRRKLLKDWFTAAQVNNRMDDGNYYAQSASETAEVEKMLLDLVRQL